MTHGKGAIMENKKVNKGTMSLKQAIERVLNRLLDMDDATFRDMIEKHSKGVVAKLIIGKCD